MNTLDIIGAIIGLFFIVSEYRADRWFWPLSLLMSAFYIVIDFSSGIYVTGLGHCHPKISEAVAQQAKKLMNRKDEER